MTDIEFKTIMELTKHIVDGAIELPTAGSLGKQISVASDTSADVFILDIDRRSTISLIKKKFQERHVNSGEVLVRVEIDARPHTNPDGKILSRNHVHVYSEEYGMSRAFDLSEIGNGLFTDPSDFSKVFYDFCKYCNINTDNVEIQGVI